MQAVRRVTGIGRHLIADLHEIEPSRLRDKQWLMGLFTSALSSTHFTVISASGHRFNSDGYGVTGFFLLSESHLAFHTYPEYGYLALDLFSCGDADPSEFLSTIESACHPGTLYRRLVNRGAAFHKSLATVAASDKAPSYEGRLFRGIVNYDSGDFTRDTLFVFRQSADVVDISFRGGGATLGNCLGRVYSDGVIEAHWHYVSIAKLIKTGWCSYTPHRNKTGPFQLQEKWSCSTDGTSGEGVLEEVWDESPD